MTRIWGAEYYNEPLCTGDRYVGAITFVVLAKL